MLSSNQPPRPHSQEWGFFCVIHFGYPRTTHLPSGNFPGKSITSFVVLSTCIFPSVTLLAPARKLATGYMTPKNLEKKYEKSLCFKKFDLSSYPKHKNI